MIAFIERHGPWIVAIISGVACRLCLPTMPNDMDVTNLMGTIINVSGVAMAFLATIQTLLLSMRENYILKEIQSLGVEHLLNDYMMNAIHSCLIVLLVSGAGFLISWKPPGHPWMFAIWVGIVLYALAACYRIIYLFSRIAKGGMK